MNKEDLLKLKKKISELSEEEKKQRDLYLKKLSNGTLQGPPVGYPSIDKSWLKYYDDESINGEISMMPFILNIICKNKNRMKMDALTYMGKTVSYEKLIIKVYGFLKKLINKGVNSNSKILIISPNTPEFAYFYLAANILCDVYIIDARTTTENIILMIEKYGITDVYTYDDKYLEINGILSKMKVNCYFSSPISTVSKLMAFIKNKKNKLSNSDLFENDIDKKTVEEAISYLERFSKSNNSTIMFTSGTTSEPKAVSLDNKSINSIVYGYENTDIDFETGDTIMFNIPNCLAYGLVISLILPLNEGLTIQCVPIFDPNNYPELIVKYRPNHIIAIPDWYNQCINSAKIQKMDLSFVKTVASGGAPMNNELIKTVNDFLINHNCAAKIIEGYGMTELSSSAITNTNSNNMPGTVGIPFVKNNVMIVGDNDEELGYNANGEVYLNSPSIMGGYVLDENETSNVKIKFNEETWIKTGDIGFVDENGFLKITGRIKRIIESYTTHKINAEILENYFDSLNYIKKCAVIPIPDEIHGKGFSVKLFVELQEDLCTDADEIIKQIYSDCQARIDNEFIPVEIEILERIPYNEHNKINYKLLEKRKNHLR